MNTRTILGVVCKPGEDATLAIIPNSMAGVASFVGARPCEVRLGIAGVHGYVHHGVPPRAGLPLAGRVIAGTFIVVGTGPRGVNRTLTASERHRVLRLLNAPSRRIVPCQDGASPDSKRRGPRWTLAVNVAGVEAWTPADGRVES